LGRRRWYWRRILAAARKSCMQPADIPTDLGVPVGMGMRETRQVRGGACLHKNRRCAIRCGKWTRVTRCETGAVRHVSTLGARPRWLAIHTLWPRCVALARHILLEKSRRDLRHEIWPQYLAAIRSGRTTRDGVFKLRPRKANSLSHLAHTRTQAVGDWREGAQMTPPVQPAYSRKFQFSITHRPSERRSKRCLHQRRLSGCGHEAGTHSLTGQRPIFEARERNEAAVRVYEDVLRLQQSCLMAHAAGQASRCMLHNVSWHMRMLRLRRELRHCWSIQLRRQ
jgi:hypothetical protein